jgi:glycosyltransferase involved in cell wall biosynthesis
MIYIVLNNSPEYGGGVEQVVGNILKNSPDNLKEKVILLCSDEKKSEEFFWKSYKCINFKVKKSFLLDKLFLFSQLKYSYKIYSFFEKNGNEGDVVNVHGVEYLFFLTLLRKRICSKLKIILTVHGSYFEQYTNFVVRRLPWKFFFIKGFFFFWRWLFFFLEKISIGGVDKYIFITKHLQEYYIRTFHVKRDISIVIRNGIEKTKENKYSNKKRSNTLVAIIIGSNFYLKGLDIALNVIKRINSLYAEDNKIKLTIVGFDDFYRHIPRERVPNFVNYIGRVDASEVKAWIRKSDFLLFPSRHEGFPLSILESIREHIPVIVSEACRFEEIPGSEKMGVIVSGYKEKEWENAMKFFMKKIFIFQKNLQKMNTEPFLCEEVARKYNDIFDGK